MYKPDHKKSKYVFDSHISLLYIIVSLREHISMYTLYGMKTEHIKHHITFS